MIHRPRVLLLGGSHACPSHTRSLLFECASMLEDLGADTRCWDVAEHDLTPVGRGCEDDDPVSASLRRAARWADAFVIATPLYHNSYSGAVKNVLDHLDVRHVGGKPAALISCSGGIPSPQAVDHLRLVVRALRGIAIPCQVLAADAEFERVDERFELTSPAARARLEQLASELLWFAERLSPRALGETATEEAALAV
jgi:NAD(P)H-dependent FMN reductase